MYMQSSMMGLNLGGAMYVCVYIYICIYTYIMDDIHAYRLVVSFFGESPCVCVCACVCMDE